MSNSNSVAYSQETWLPFVVDRPQAVSAKGFAWLDASAVNTVVGGRIHLEESRKSAHEDPWRLLQAQFADLAKLRDDWNSYGAPAPNGQATSLARMVLDHARGMSIYPHAVVPSTEGGVTLVFSRDSRYGDIECFNDGEILALTSAPPLEPNVWPVAVDSADIQQALEHVSGFVEKP